MATSTPTDTIPNVRRLAQYRPFERGGLDLQAVLRDLVLAVAAIGNGTIESLFECRKSFLDLWKLEVEIDELRVVVDELAESGVVLKKGKGIIVRAPRWFEDPRFERYSQLLAARSLAPTP